VCRYPKGFPSVTLYSALLGIGGNEKNSRQNDAAQTAFRSDPPMPVVLDTLERGENVKDEIVDNHHLGPLNWQDLVAFDLGPLSTV